MRTIIICTLFLSINSIYCKSQNLQGIGLKIGLNFSGQTYENIPTIVQRLGVQDTIAHGGGFNRTGINILLYKEILASNKIRLLIGIGYRQRGFLSENKFNSQTGYVEILPEGKTNNNRFDNIYADVAVKLRRYREGKPALYLLIL